MIKRQLQSTMYLKLLRLFIFTAILLTGTLVAHAQSGELARSEMDKILQFYDNTVYLAFNTLYSYDTDTVQSKAVHTSLNGEYNMYGRKCLYRVGNIEYLRNDSFTIAAYNDDKFLVVAPVRLIKGASSTLPVRDMIDSLFSGFFNYYDIYLNTIIDGEDTVKRIAFTGKKEMLDSLPYTHFYVDYDSVTYALHSIEYGLKKSVDIETEDTASITNTVTVAQLPWNVQFKIRFSDYRTGRAEDDVFSERQFINEESPGKWVGKGKYAGYKLYWSDDEYHKSTIIN